LTMVLPTASFQQRRKASHGLSDLATTLNLSLALNAVLAISCLFMGYYFFSANLHSTDLTWNGGHPRESRPGTCFCGGDNFYCMCTPSLAIDLVIVTNSDEIWLVRRKDTSQLATCGGFVLVGETVEDAVRGELKEETGLDLNKPPQLFGLFSDPRRDNRRHTTSAVYVIYLDGNEHPVAADDVKAMKRIHMKDIEKHEYFSDHRTILLDFRKWHLHEKDNKSEYRSSLGDFADDIDRSLCDGSLTSRFSPK